MHGVLQQFAITGTLPDYLFALRLRHHTLQYSCIRVLLGTLNKMLQTIEEYHNF